MMIYCSLTGHCIAFILAFVDKLESYFISADLFQINTQLNDGNCDNVTFVRLIGYRSPYLITAVLVFVSYFI